jgi:hypothetical protein
LISFEERFHASQWRLELSAHHGKDYSGFCAETEYYLAISSVYILLCVLKDAVQNPLLNIFLLQKHILYVPDMSPHCKILIISIEQHVEFSGEH